MSFDPGKIASNLNWLKDYSHFNEKPASILEFLEDDYLRIAKGVRPGIRDELIELFGDEVNGWRIARYTHAMFTGAIGIGKTTIASIILPYMVHWCLCLKDPQDFFELLPGSRIAFMQMSTGEEQAKEVIFGDIKARINYSPWFQNFPYDKSFKNQMRFENEIWVIPGNSAETRFEGYNILGGILDEADSHKETQEKNYAELGYDAIDNRISSRFNNRGFLIVIGQMKKASGFAKQKYDELNADSNAHTVRMTIWESLGWERFLNSDGSRDSFWYDTKRKEIVPIEAVALLEDADHLIEIPNAYKNNFVNNPEKALRDLAGIPPAAGSPFISLTHKIDEAFARWLEHHEGYESPVNDDPRHPVIADWLTANDSLKRCIHLDIAYSGDGDAAGIAMGHVSHLVEFEGNLQPYIVIDMALRVRANSGQEILLSDLRRYVYQVADDRGFKIKAVSMDGFESTETRQQFKKRRYQTLYVSIDKSKLPYEDLRDAIYEDRIELPTYQTYLRSGTAKRVNIIAKELMELEENDKKIDHPINGSKDVTDAIAGVVTTLMGDRSYRRGVTSLTDYRQQKDDEQFSTGTDDGGYSIGGHYLPGLGGMGLQAPIPPSSQGADIYSLPVPPGLRPPRRG